MSNVKMADLTAGTRIRHVAWEMTGTVRVTGDVHEIRWDDTFGEIEISDGGPVFPEDIEIVAREATS